MPDKGTVDHDFSHPQWLEIDGNRVYIQRTILNNPDSISYPEKYRHKLPCVIQIQQRYKKLKGKVGELMYPDLYVLRNHMILEKKVKKIQKGKCVGWVVPISELEHYIPGRNLV